MSSNIATKKVKFIGNKDATSTKMKGLKVTRAHSLKVQIGPSSPTNTSTGTSNFAYNNRKLVRSESVVNGNSLEELVQCGICLEKLSKPRMLPCQHTFCLNCLQTHLTAKSLKFAPGKESKERVETSSLANIKTLGCPLCQQVVELEKGFESLENLPKNLYIDSLLKLIDEKASPTSPKVMDYRCVKCQTVSEHQEQICQHCMQIFCNICWREHLNELQDNLSVLIKQLTESEHRLRYKSENFGSRCDQLNENIKDAVQRKIMELYKIEKDSLLEVTSIKDQGHIGFQNICKNITELKDKIAAKSTENFNSGHKVATYLHLHRETSKLLDVINHFGEARVTFDPQTFKLEQYAEGHYSETIYDETTQSTVANPFESSDSMAKYYKTLSFTPKLLWTKCPRPAGIGIPPWDLTKLYIATTDHHDVLILNRTKIKLVSRLTNPEMICPTGIAFLNHKKEVYISDKWKHCIHVFSNEGTYLRALCAQKELRSPDGIAITANKELVVCDSGNNRVLIVDPESGEKLSTLGLSGSKTCLNFPTSVAVHNNNIIIADTGNNRIKIFDIQSGELLDEFGSFGRNPGQFRSAEVVAVDPLGFIFVGDAGNARVQVFKPDGTLVKIFGSKQGFGWVSGIFITTDLDIITTDIKKRSLRIF